MRNKNCYFYQNAMAEFWVLPIIQGFVQVEKCKVDLGRFEKTREAMEPVFEVLQIKPLKIEKY